MNKIKVLNLYAGIGGNRKLWENVDVTAIEYDPEIARIYQDLYPEDNVIICDAHKYLLDHYEEFDFIWSSPPCPTHSRMRTLCHVKEGMTTPYPDMKLYQEIIFLKHWFKGKFVVENVISYYEPLIKPFESENHYFWSNFNIAKRNKINRNIRSNNNNYKKWGFNLNNINLQNKYKEKMINNLVNPCLGLFILNEAFKTQQKTLNLI